MKLKDDAGNEMQEDVGPDNYDVPRQFFIVKAKTDLVQGDFYRCNKNTMTGAAQIDNTTWATKLTNSQKLIPIQFPFFEFPFNS